MPGSVDEAYCGGSRALGATPSQESGNADVQVQGLHFTGRVGTNSQVDSAESPEPPV